MPAVETSFDEIAEAVEAVKQLQDQLARLLQAVTTLDKRVQALEAERTSRG